MGMALRAVADDGDAPVLDEGQIGVFVVVDSHRILYLNLAKYLCLVPLRVAHVSPERRRLYSLSHQPKNRLHTRSAVSPRAIPDTPERTTSRISFLSMPFRKASIFSLVPVSSMT